ncbi:hypothetical protein [uncultured Alistipes sp.]|uniref:leucine-rich repeat domain-containing protein n=1 Tax=uncultured Alistipes sp. TaxID=538949 RepID=UPI0025EBE957|nr:hypothetical protein [uncultured Alistipes sp.]
MKKIVLLLSSIILVATGCSKDEPKNPSEDWFEQIPDPVFREYCRRFDVDHDGKLSHDEILAVKRINFVQEGITTISSLVGIEYFTALEYLDCRSNQLAGLDVAKNTMLTKLYCNFNELSSLDISANTVLKELFCSTNKLSHIDVSKNIALTDFDCSYNQLTNLDVSKNTALTRFSCSVNKLKNIDVVNNIALATFYCLGNQLETLNISKNRALWDMDCTDNITGLRIFVWRDFDVENPENSIQEISTDPDVVFVPVE